MESLFQVCPCSQCLEGDGWLAFYGALDVASFRLFVPKWSVFRERSRRQRPGIQASVKPAMVRGPENVPHHPVDTAYLTPKLLKKP
jgi:hypothetical protein